MKGNWKEAYKSCWRELWVRKKKRKEEMNVDDWIINNRDMSKRKVS